METPPPPRAPWLPVVAVIAASLWVAWHLRGGYWIDSHERIWYPVRLVEWMESWRAGAWYPRWCPDLYGSYGYPFFNYYAPGVFAAAGAFMGVLGLGPAAALKLQASLFLVGGGVGVYGLARGETRRADAALLAAIIFVFAPYRATDLFTRGDLAEHAAFSLVPFALWAHRALWRVPDGRIAAAATLGAIAHAAILFCHTITGLFTTEILLAALALSWWTRRRDPDARRRALAAAVTLALGVAVAAVYVLPAIVERKLVRLDALTMPQFSPSANGIELWWLGTPFFSLGLPAMAAAWAWLVALAVPSLRRRAWESGARWWIPVALLALVMTKTVAPIFDLLPFGRFIQFPWRLLGFIAVFASVGCAAVFALVRPSRVTWAAALALAVGVVGVERPLVEVATFLAEFVVPSTAEAVREKLVSTVVANEYLPQTVNGPPVVPRSLIAAVADGDVTLEAKQATPLAYWINADARGPATVDVAVFAFPGWKLATDAGPGKAEQWISPAGMVRITLPKAGRYKLRVWFGETPLRGAAAALSWLALLGAYPLLARLRRRR